jgi:hypothetical protein
MQNVVIQKIYLERDFAAGVNLSETQNPIPPSHLHTVYVYTVYLFTHGKWGGGESSTRGEG